MKIARLQGPWNLAVEDMDRPAVGSKEVLVKVANCGVCGTDVEVYQGKVPRGWTITYPLRMGHELSGTVVEVGAEVPGLRPGDRVAADGRLTCGYCYYCRRGMWSACRNQGYMSGGLAEYSAYPFQNLVKVPAELSLAEAAFGEPLACVVNGQSKLDVPLGGVAVVIGDGAIGNMHAQMLVHRGAYTVLAGQVDHRLAIAAGLGVNRTVNATREDVAAVVSEVSDGRGADVVVVAAGNSAVLKQAIAIAGRRAQVLYFAATLEPAVTLDLDQVHYKELCLIGTYDSTIAQYEQALALVRAGAVAVKPLLTHCFPLGEVTRAYETARKLEGLKVQIVHEGA